MLTGGEDLVVRLWDTEAFTRKLVDPDEKKAARAAERAGAVAADVALGWECVRELRGHTKAVRDVAIHPDFKGPHPGEEPDVHQRAKKERESKIDARENGTTVSVGGAKLDGIRTSRDQAAVPARVEYRYMLASASADASVRIWDLSFNPRIARCFYVSFNFLYMLSVRLSVSLYLRLLSVSLSSLNACPSKLPPSPPTPIPIPS